MFVEPRDFDGMMADGIGEAVRADEVDGSCVVFKCRCRTRRRKTDRLKELT